MNPIDQTAPLQTESISFEFDLGFKPDQKREFGGARYGRNLMGGKLVDLLARIP